jgi:hypothetical protein
MGFPINLRRKAEKMVKDDLGNLTEETIERSTPIPTRGGLSANTLGASLGLTGVMFYLGCMITMATVPREQSVNFFNGLLHGIDVEPILRDSVPSGEVAIGIVTTFALGWIAGLLIAHFYNWGQSIFSN